MVLTHHPLTRYTLPENMASSCFLFHHTQLTDCNLLTWRFSNRCKHSMPKGGSKQIRGERLQHFRSVLCSTLRTPERRQQPLQYTGSPTREYGHATGMSSPRLTLLQVPGLLLPVSRRLQKRALHLFHPKAPQDLRTPIKDLISVPLPQA